VKHVFVFAAVLATAVPLTVPADAAERTVMLAVENMYCNACPFIVKRSLARVSGVETVVVSFERKTAKVIFDDSKTTLAALTTATKNAGYPSKPLP
jgi:periplasmic mercuric ion binding protein